MEAPTGRDPDALRDEKQRAFRAMRPLTATDVVRGQFRGYRKEEGVASDSQVETFAAVRLHIDAWRWAGVPFSFELASRCRLPQPKYWLNSSVHHRQCWNNRPKSSELLSLSSQPRCAIALGARDKMPGEAMVGEHVELLVRPGSERNDPYERLLGDAIRGDSLLLRLRTA